MSNEPPFNDTGEPTAPIIDYRGRPIFKSDLVGSEPADTRQRKLADYDAYQQDLAERQARAAEFRAKRKAHEPGEIKVELSAIDEALNGLEQAAEDFEQSHGKPNQPLIDAKIETERLRGELAEAEARLNAIEARGDSIQRLTDAVRIAESQLQSLVSKAENKEVSRLAEEHYGWAISWEENKKDFPKHASVLVLKTFYVPRTVVQPGQIPSVDSLQEQLHRVGQKLVALREHLAEVAH